MLMHKQMGDVGIESSQGRTRHSIELMARHQVPPTPSNCCLWHNYAAGGIPSLQQEMDDMLQHYVAFMMQKSVRLFEKYFGTDGEARGLEHIGENFGQVTVTIGVAFHRVN